MVLDPMGGIVLTNDGNAILREVRTREKKIVDFNSLPSFDLF